MKKIGIIICSRYQSCGGGKCFRSVRERTGGFARYSKDETVEVVGFSNCGGCPGGNIEYVPEEMKKNGAEVIHLATGFVVGYPPCPYIVAVQAVHRVEVRHPRRGRDASHPPEVFRGPPEAALLEGHEHGRDRRRPDEGRPRRSWNPTTEMPGIKRKTCGSARPRDAGAGSPDDDLEAAARQATCARWRGTSCGPTGPRSLDHWKTSPPSRAPGGSRRLCPRPRDVRRYHGDVGPTGRGRRRRLRLPDGRLRHDDGLRQRGHVAGDQPDVHRSPGSGERPRHPRAPGRPSRHGRPLRRARRRNARRALADHLAHRNAPWKKGYRKTQMAQPLVEHFQKTAASYDAWYDAHPALYRTELAALKKAVPGGGRGLEIGVGTGRFASRLSVRYGLDPSPGMLGQARHRGIRAVRGFGEALPSRPGASTSP
ncbi:MAG: CGGC domain-containing protein [Desulfobacterales bacterium]|nr:CGGC domain-containing protein [Desulfobacterales bacterium]